MKKGLIIAAGLAACVSAQAVWTSANGVTVYTDETEWLNALNASWDTYHNGFSASEVLEATEITSTPSDETDLTKTLTFDAANTGFSVSYSLTATQEDVFDWNSTEDVTVGTGSGGNDNIVLDLLSGKAVYAAGFTLLGNEFGSDEGLYVYDSTDTLITSFDTQPLVGGSGSRVFLGVIADQEIGKIWFDEDDGSDGMGLDDIRIAAVPEPATVGLLAISVLLLGIYRRWTGRC